MTTITQSLVKGLYFRHFRPGIRKIRQSLIARFALDGHMSKQRLLAGKCERPGLLGRAPNCWTEDSL
jgi:hypothetical protein